MAVPTASMAAMQMLDWRYPQKLGHSANPMLPVAAIESLSGQPCSIAWYDCTNATQCINQPSLFSSPRAACVPEACGWRRAICCALAQFHSNCMSLNACLCDMQNGHQQAPPGTASVSMTATLVPEWLSSSSYSGQTAIQASAVAFRDVGQSCTICMSPCTLMPSSPPAGLYFRICLFDVE